MVKRVFVEKKPEFALEARELKNQLVDLLSIKSIKNLRVFNRYDVEGIDDDLFNYSIKNIFSEPPVDNIYFELPENAGDTVFAVEYLPGQFDQRANSAAECIQIVSMSKRPLVRTAKVYILDGNISENELIKIKNYLINPVDSRETSIDKFNSLTIDYDIPKMVEVLDGFDNMDDDALLEFLNCYSLAMDFDDLKFCQSYFRKIKRNPTITEIKVIDTYWSDHCRHTTFNTIIENVEFEDELVEQAYNDYLNVRESLERKKPITLMDIATICTKYLSKKGFLDNLDKSDEINACTVKIKAEFNGKKEDWLLLFKNETHNHPTEIEPFGGAATCIGGAIRDPLSGRAYVYAAMRITGAANPLEDISNTLNGKLPQRKIVTTSADGYSSYGNQIGLATGQVDEIYHQGFLAKRMEVGAVIAAAPSKNVIRQAAKPTDKVILLGGRTGRDGCGGATGSSKSHTIESLESCGTEVQKGNAPEERKLQRLFRNEKASRLIKRCNDFGAGGVCVAIGELADGLRISLDLIPKKYEGLDGTELAISESQERMAVVVDEKNADIFCKLAMQENIEATVVATVTDNPDLVMIWRNKEIVNISREFLNSNGAAKNTSVKVSKQEDFAKETPKDFIKGYESIVSNLNVCSKQGLSEQFDSTIGAGTVLMPFGGRYQRTPIQAMVHLISCEDKASDTCSFMAWGYNPYILEKNTFSGAYLAVIESVCKLIATGASRENIYLSFQEYFERLSKDKIKWGKPFSALLGAFKAQMDLKISAIGGKDSMSGTFEDLSVPPTLISFAITADNVDRVISPEFKMAGNKVIMLNPDIDRNKLPVINSLEENIRKINELIENKQIYSCYTPTFGGRAEAIYKMAIGNEIGIDIDENVTMQELFDYAYGSFIIEIDSAIDVVGSKLLGYLNDTGDIRYKDFTINLNKLSSLYESKLESVYHFNRVDAYYLDKISNISYKANSNEIIHSPYRVNKPKVLIPVFPGTNCEYDSKRAFENAGASVKLLVINNQTPEKVRESVDKFADEIKSSQIIFIPGGFSGADEPDGSGKLITSFFRNDKIKIAVNELLNNRQGLMAGICNGFQALIKLGLLPYGKIMDNDVHSPTLTYNDIGRHQSKIVNIAISSNKSPWLSCVEHNVYKVPISHGEGKFVCSKKQLQELAKNGQILSQYVDLNGNATMDIRFNPNGSYYAVEGLLSPDGRILGKMGHSERIGDNLYRNVIGNYDMKMFRSAVEYFI